MKNAPIWPRACEHAGVRPIALRTPTLPPATHTNSYLLDLGDSCLLVEPSPSSSAEQERLVAWLRAECSKKPLRALLATHHHPDHVGAVAHLAQTLGAPLWGHARLAQHRPDCALQRVLDDGDMLPSGWQVLHTPGHASDHLCLWQPNERVLIAGDMVASVGTIVVPPGDGSMSEYLRQLRRLDALDALVVLPAHGEPVTAAHDLFEYYIEHREAREAKIARVLAAQRKPCSLHELLPLTYDDAPQKAWPIAIYSLQAHLDKLIEQGDAACDAEGRYRALSRA